MKRARGKSEKTEVSKKTTVEKRGSGSGTAKMDKKPAKVTGEKYFKAPSDGDLGVSSEKGAKSTPEKGVKSAPKKRTKAPEGKTKSTRAEGKKVMDKKKKKHVIWASVAISVVVLICVGTAVIFGVGSGMYAAVTREIDDLDFEAMAYNFSSIVYADDKDGNSVEVEFLHNDGNREWVEMEKIPKIAKDAAIAIEDERFYSHNGVDYKRTAGAVFGWISAKVTGGEPEYGGSTITQQVIKNLTQEKEKTVSRKIMEMMRAVAFEKQFTKEEILSAYLNIIYFGNQCYGIESAAKMYYSKSAIDLTLPEAAMIVGITQAPSRFDPFKNPENALTKRNTVLKKMQELGKITKEEYDQAVATPLGVNDNRAPIESKIYNYFIDQVISDVIADLQEEKGYSHAFATSQVFGGGLKIYTTMDSNVQAAMEEVYENTANFPGASRGIQSAMVVMDPTTGQVKGMIGGIGEKTESRGLNRATQSTRQPGSSTKPISVYGPALEMGKITASSMVADAPLKVGSWSPKNSYSGFKGSMTVRKAIEISANIPAVRTLQLLGTEESYDFLVNKLGISSLTSKDKESLAALSLGGMSKGISPLEMTAAYATFANEGVYIEPHTYTKVVDKSGKVILEKKPVTRRAMSKGNAYIMSTMLKDVVNGASGTGKAARLSKMPTYGKTGTSNGNNDKWFCGYTPYYVGAAWYGYDRRASVGGTNISAQVWKKVMEKIHEGLPVKDFEKPDDVITVSVCTATGKLSSSGCRYARKDVVAKGSVTTYCSNKHTGLVGATSGKKDEDEEKPKKTEEPTETEEPIVTENPMPGTITEPVIPDIPILTPPPVNPEPEPEPITPEPITPEPEPVTPSTPAPTPIIRPTAAPSVPDTPVFTPAPVAPKPATPAPTPAAPKPVEPSGGESAE